jgi:teichuronic acid biosynthesis glycosyltransferase TuaG
MSKVSIIIPFYNCPYIDQAIESALNQTYTNIEVIVVNDGSTQYMEKITPFLNRIRYIEKENGGTASALNLGIKNATGDYFSWLSSDDLFHRDKIFKQLNFMKEKNAYFSYTNYSLIDAYNYGSPEMAGMHFADKIALLHYLRTSNPINGCTVMMKMVVFSIIGLFNEQLKFTQDYDFWLRTVQNYEIYYLHEPLVKYRIHSQMGTQRFSELLVNEVQILRGSYDHTLMELINHLGK